MVVGFAVRLGRLDYDRIDHRRGISSSHLRLVRHAPANALIAVVCVGIALRCFRRVKPDKFRATQCLGIRILRNQCTSSEQIALALSGVGIPAVRQEQKRKMAISGRGL